MHKQDGNYFHPKNDSTQVSFSEILENTPAKVTISGRSGNGAWECRWDFFLTHCTFTMTKMPEKYKYWILYEGTPGGGYDSSDYYMTSSVAEKIPIITPYNKDLPDPEWIAFGDEKTDRVIFLASHTDDNKPDKYYPMDGQMTVFGFGRDGIKKYIDQVPWQFSIGFIKSTDHKKIEKTIHKLIRFQ